MEDEVLQVSVREDLGTANSRRLRASGHIPAILYGHGEENVCLTVAADQLHTALRHGSQLVQLRGALDESALIREIQWDAFGNSVLHLDLTRVSAGEKVEVTVSLDIKGDAPGTRDGGLLQHVLHSVQVRCPANAIPDTLLVSVNELQLGNAITIADLEIPDKVEVLAEPSDVVVQCQVVEEQEEPEEGVAGDVSEPEVIGRKESDEEEE